MVFHEHDTGTGNLKSLLHWGKPEDLAEGEFWTGTFNPGHGGDQRFAYDVGIVKYNHEADDWLETRNPMQLGTGHNEDYLVFGKKVHSISRGEVIESYDNASDNIPGEGSGYAQTNHIRIKLNDNEVILYSHLLFGSIPSHLKNSDPNKREPPQGTRVDEGDLIGRVGNSGSSSHPHLHIHVQKFGRRNPTSGDLTSYSEGILIPLVLRHTSVSGGYPGRPNVDPPHGLNKLRIEGASLPPPRESRRVLHWPGWPYSPY